MGEDYARHLYGDLPAEPTQERTKTVYTDIKQIDAACHDKQVTVRARIHNSRVKGNLAFLVLRESFYTIQTVACKSETVSKQMIKFIQGIPNESIVDVTGKALQPEVPVESCSQKLELQIEQIFVVNRSKTLLPFQISDAS